MQSLSVNDFQLPEWATENQASAMEQSLSRASMPGFISFALGLPALDFFPVTSLQKVFNEVLALGHSVLQYKPPIQELKSQIKQIMAIRGVTCHEDQIILTSGAQQGISIITRLLLQKNSTVIVEELVYPGLLQAIKPLNPKILTVKTDSASGIDVSAVEAILKQGTRPAFLYLVSDGGNPSSVSLSNEKRKYLAMLSQRYGMPIIEDDPYGFLNYVEQQAPLKKYGGDWVFYIGSFAKLLAPSLRVGWIVAPACMVGNLSSIKESSDINMATFNHHLVNALLKELQFEHHIQQLQNQYLKRRNIITNALIQHFPADVGFTPPNCGFFIWMNLHQQINTSVLLDKALEHKVAFIPSEAFAATKEVRTYNGMRINFSNPKEDEIDEGIRRLSLAYQSIVRSK